MKGRGVSSTAKYRKKLKEEKPEEYQIFLQQERERNKRNKENREKRWCLGTKEAQMEKEAFIEHRRQKARNLYKKKKGSVRQTKRNKAAASLSQEKPGKRRKDMTEEERRLHDNKLKQTLRNARTPQKKAADRKKDAAYKQRKRDSLKVKASKKGAKLKKKPQPIKRLRQDCYNSISKVKKFIASKAVNGQEEARMATNIFFRQTRTKRNAHIRVALEKPGVRETMCKELFGSDEPPAKRRKTDSKAQSGPFKRVTITIRTAKKHARCQLVKNFYRKDIISRVLPHARYATKAGPGRVLLYTLKEAYEEFGKQYPQVSVKFGLFAFYRPKEVRLLGTVNLDKCLCVLCTNVGLKLCALNANENVEQLKSETQMLATLLCPFPRKGWPKMDCVQGDCARCRDLIRPLTCKCHQAFFDEIRWTHWERKKVEGKSKLELIHKSGTVGDLLEELAHDLQEPTKGKTFVQHLFTAYWQKSQFDQCQNNLKQGQVMLLQDFAENSKAIYPGEVKSGKRQITLHPTVCYFKDSEGQLVRRVHMFLSDNIPHDYHAVHHFTLKSIQLLEGEMQVDQVIIWSDGAASQYKGKGSMGDLTLYGRPVQRNYFGSEHGKGESDGETGWFAQSLKRAAAKGNPFRDASDLAKFGRENTKESAFKKYVFIVVPPEDIQRDRPKSEVATLKGSRSLHQFCSGIRPYALKARKFSCFCTSCIEGTGICAKEGFVSPYEQYQLEPRSTIPSVGDWLEIKGQVPRKKGKSKEMLFYAVVQENPVSTENFYVKFLKATKVGTFVFSDVPNLSEIAPGEPCNYEWRVVQAPKMLIRPGSSRTERLACQYLFD